MPSIIKKHQEEYLVVDDPWKLLRIPPGETAETVRLPLWPLLVPVSVWRARRTELIVREYEYGWPVGVWLAPDKGPETIAADLDDFPVIAIDFPKFTDGRGYSTARLLRERYRYRGELRAVGDVGRDQLFFLARAGFDAFVLKPGEDPHAALKGLRDFSVTYQGAADDPLPLFRRRTA